MQNSTTTVQEKAAICLAWIKQEKAAICLAWIEQNGSCEKVERPTVSLDLEDVDAFLG